MPGEPLLRATIFTGVFVVLALVELAFPHHGDERKGARWGGNLALFALGILGARLALPMGSVGLAGLMEAHGIGFFNLLAWPGWLTVPLAVIVFDFLIWCQHLVFHKVDWLWRLHRVHHADEAMDVTTGLRFHPLEIALSLGIKSLAMALIGPPAFAVFLFEVLLNAGAMATHANWKLPVRIDRALRFLVVTPGMHRVHHARDWGDSNANFGFNLAIWDRMFRTYRPEPKSGDAAVRFGVEGFSGETRVVSLITQPFRDRC